MTANRSTRRFVDDFDRAQTFTSTPGMNGWTSKLTGTTPTSATITSPGGAAKLAIAATSESEIATLYQNDVLWLPAGYNQLHWISWDILVAGIDAVTTLVAGIATAENDAIASVTNAAWFKILGSTSTSAVVIDTKDGTNTNTNVATGKTLAATALQLLMDFTFGLSDVRFYIDGDRVAGGTTFNMSGLSATQGLQPYLQIGKASGTGVPSVTALQFACEYNDVMGS